MLRFRSREGPGHALANSCVASATHMQRFRARDDRDSAALVPRLRCPPLPSGAARMPTAPPNGWKLFIPGPTHVRPAIREAMALPMISHRGEEMKQLLADLLPAVREAFGTKGDVVVLSCSSSAALEAASRGAVRPGRRVL